MTLDEDAAHRAIGELADAARPEQPRRRRGRAHGHQRQHGQRDPLAHGAEGHRSARVRPGRLRRRRAAARRRGRRHARHPRGDRAALSRHHLGDGPAHDRPANTTPSAPSSRSAAASISTGSTPISPRWRRTCGSNSPPIASKPTACRFVRDGDLRYVGQGYELKRHIPRRHPWTEAARRGLEPLSRGAQREYGHYFADNPIEIVNIRVIGIGHMPKIDKLTAPQGTTADEGAGQDRPVRVPHRRQAAPVRDRFLPPRIFCPSARLSQVPPSCCRRTRRRSFRPAAPRPTMRPAISFSRSQGMPDERH